MSGGGGGGGGGNSPFAWLGLLKWSLAYTDGTSSSSSADGSAPPPPPMSEEDRAFLELVMTEGIVDEGERMKVILRELTYGLVSMLGDDADGGGGGGGDRREGGGGEEEKRMDPPADEGGMLDLLGELRDIVEQIDYARAFSAMGGAPFLLGLATHRHRPADDDAGGGCDGRRTIIIPDSLRGGALRTLSTMCQNNPPVQSCLLGCDHVTPLARLFLDRTPGIGDDDGREGGDEDGGDDSVRADVVQALSASARGFPPGELALCDGDGGAAVALLLGLGLGMTATAATTERREGSPPPPPPPSSARGGGGGGDDGARPTGPARPPSARLRRRSLFLLRALLTSDDATDERHGRFRDVVDHVITRLIDDAWEADAEVREMGLAMATGLLRHEGVGGAGGGGGGGARASSKTMILRHRDHIGSVGVRRIRAIRDLEDGSEEKESATLELEEWENLMVALAEAGNERGGGDAPPLAVCDMHVP